MLNKSWELTAVGPVGFRNLYYHTSEPNIIAECICCRGYMAPEYVLWGILTYKADVYSFGVVVLEIVAGKNNRKHGPNENPACLLDWVRYILPMFFWNFTAKSTIRSMKPGCFFWSYSIWLGQPALCFAGHKVENQHT